MFENSTSPDMSGPILVIDDEPYILRSLSYLLQRSSKIRGSKART
jgi:hypothetical protein